MTEPSAVPTEPSAEPSAEPPVGLPPGLPTYRDAHAAVEARVEDLLGRMTLAEKVGQMCQLEAEGDLVDLIEHRATGSVLKASPDDMRLAIEIAAGTRLGIPLLTADDCIHGHSFWPGATIFPTQLAMACTWDASLVEQVARATAVEVSATGIHWTFSPVLCIARDPRWGRVDETFGEDPVLIGELGAAMVRGYQGEGLQDPTAILACAKHFAGYSETQGGRDASEADLTTRKLRSWFLPPFEQAVAAGCRTVMLGYQAIDGVPVTANRWLLQDVLKGEWGFAGTLITDWDNVGRMVWEQQVQPDYEQAAAVAVRAGNDLVMATPRFFAAAQAAVRNGLLAEAELDDAVRRILRLKFELGLFEDPRAPDPERQAAVIGCADHTALNLEVARRALVLLRNDGTLPLEGGLLAGDDGRADPHGPPRTIAVIGPNADDPHALLGDWAGASGQVPWMLPDGHPRALVQTVLDGFRAVVPEDWQVVHARGADIREPVDPSNPVDPANPVDGAQAEDPRAPRFTPAQPDPALLADAVAAAESADWAVVVVGDTIELVGEYRSTATLELQGGQLALLDAVAATGTPMLVVLVHSKPAVLPPAVLGAAAIVEAFNPGMQGGRAIAELVLGLIEPQGRLPISVPRHAGQLPVYYNQVRGQHGDRYADLTQEPQFAFGEGLTYTRVDYADLMLARDVLGPDDVVRAQVTLANRGTRPAHELVQAYVSDVVTSVTWAARELKAWRRVVVLPGERVVVELEVPVSACTIVAADGRRCVEPGAFDLLVGPSSKPEDLLGARFTVVD